MERLFVVRHGQRVDLVDLEWRKTAENPYDTPLSAHGLEQAEQLARFFDREIAHSSSGSRATVLSSPYTRALQTALPTARALGVRLCVEPGICESEFRAIDKFGDGKTMLPFPSVMGLPEIEALVGAERVNEGWQPLVARPTSFESTEQCYARGEAVVEALERASAAGRLSGTVVLFTHAAMVLAVVRAALDDKKYDSMMPVCGVCELRRDGARWALVRDADASMLDKGAEHAWNFAKRSRVMAAHVPEDKLDAALRGAIPLSAATQESKHSSEGDSSGQGSD